MQRTRLMLPALAAAVLARFGVAAVRNVQRRLPHVYDPAALAGHSVRVGPRG
jgi:hypothetical protein